MLRFGAFGSPADLHLHRVGANPNGFCLFVAAHSAGASLRRRTKHPLRPSSRGSFFPERSKAQCRKRLFLQPCSDTTLQRRCKRAVEKCARPLKCRAVPALDASSNSCLTKRILQSTDARKAGAFLYHPAPADDDRFTIFPTDKGAITQAQSVRKIRITSCGFYGRLLCPLKCYIFLMNKRESR